MRGGRLAMRSDKVFWAAWMLCIVMANVGCGDDTAAVTNCSETAPCVDPDKLFCDLWGEYPESNGVSHVCIAWPEGFDGGSDADVDGGVVGDSGIPIGAEQAVTVVSPTQQEFSTQAIGTVSSSKTFTVTNTATIDSWEIAISIDGSAAFAVESNQCIASLKPDESCDFTVVFAPDSVGTHETTVTVKDIRGETALYLSGAGSSSAALANLRVLYRQPLALVPEFDFDTTTYAAAAPLIAQQVRIEPTAVDPAATIRVNENSVASGTESEEIAISDGGTTISIVVTAPDTDPREYQVTVEPSVELQQYGRVVPPSGSISDRGLAISDDTIIVGIPAASGGADQDQAGEAYVYWRSEYRTSVQRLRANPQLSNAYFGLNVATDNDVIVAGAPYELPDQSNIHCTGALYAFSCGDCESLYYSQKLRFSDAADSCGQVGYSVAVEGDVIVAGAPQDSNTQTSSGAVHVFKRAGSNGDWTHVERLKTATPALGALLGSSVAISGDAIIAGAPYEDANGKTDSGAAYVFERDSKGEWMYKQRLTASYTAASDRFGYSVAIGGNVIAIGTPYDDNSSATDSGAVYVFERSSEGEWVYERRLVASDCKASDNFGYSVNLSGEVMVVGAPYADSTDATDSGAVYLFRRDAEGNWNEKQRIQNAIPLPNSEFGGQVVITSSEIAVLTLSPRAAYLFR